MIYYITIPYNTITQHNSIKPAIKRASPFDAIPCSPLRFPRLAALAPARRACWSGLVWYGMVWSGPVRSGMACAGWVDSLSAVVLPAQRTRDMALELTWAMAVKVEVVGARGISRAVASSRLRGYARPLARSHARSQLNDRFFDTHSYKILAAFELCNSRERHIHTYRPTYRRYPDSSSSRSYIHTPTFASAFPIHEERFITPSIDLNKVSCEQVLGCFALLAACCLFRGRIGARSVEQSVESPIHSHSHSHTYS